MADSSEHRAIVEELIGYQFVNGALLETALTHSSYASENDVESYERLEFLGDAVLELAITERVFADLDGASEGRMTKVRSAIVDEGSLAAVCNDIGLQSAIRLGVGEDRNGGRTRASIQSDVIEAVLGAVYVDGGTEAAFAVVYRLLGDVIADRLSTTEVIDFRSKLQERLAQSGKQVAFEYDRSGPDHAVVYVASAFVEGEVIGTGTGGSKKAAAIDAARAALAEPTSDI